MRHEARSLAESGEERKECWKFEENRERMNNYLGSWENKFPREVSCLTALRPVIINLKPVHLAWFCDFL